MNKIKFKDIKTLEQLMTRMEKLKEKDTYFLKCGNGHFHHISHFFHYSKREKGDIKVYVDVSYIEVYRVKIFFIKKETQMLMALNNGLAKKENKVFKI
nr:hypothetical protein [uncultured Pseudogulbenkiania sp.]